MKNEKLHLVLTCVLIAVVLVQCGVIGYLFAVKGGNNSKDETQTATQESAVEGEGETEPAYTDNSATYDDQGVASDVSKEPVTTYTPTNGDPDAISGNHLRRDGSVKNIVVLGDSIFGSNRSEDGICKQLEIISGAKVYNCGFGGMYLSNQYQSFEDSYPSDAFSCDSLVDSIVSDDFAFQEYAMNLLSNKGDYFESTLFMLESIDFSKIDMLVVAFGTNDYLDGRLIENNDSAYDCTATLGSLRYSLKRIKETYPSLQTVVVSPPYCIATNEYGESIGCEIQDNGYGTLYDLGVNMAAIAKDAGMDYIDVLNDCGIDKTNAAQYLTDGIHPNAAGRFLIAKLIAEEMNQIAD